MGMLLVSIILISPAAYPYAARAVAVLLRPIWGVEGRLAVRQLERNSNRTSLTGAVLCVALVVTIAMGQSIRNNIGDLQEWTTKTITADYLVRTTLPDLGFTINALIPESLKQELEPLEGVSSVHSLNFFQSEVNGRQVIVLAREFADDETATLDIAVGDRDSVVRGLLAGETVVGNALAQQLNVTVGDELQVKTRRGVKSLRVAGVVTEYIVGGMAIYINRERARELFGFDGADVFMVTAKPGAIERLGKELAQFCDARGLSLQSNEEFRSRIAQMVAGVVGFLWLLLGLVFVVASLGIVNTLTMNVLEQTREIAVLRTVAMRRRQIRLMILYQAASLGLASLGPGVVLGLVLSYLMNLSTHALIGQPVAFTVSFWYVAGCCGACLAMALIAAWFPARRASRLEIIHALQYE
jgi:putative ABC transport system permease protein